MSFAFQIFSLPLLVAFLGVDDFAIYSVLVTAVGWVFLLSSGISPAVTRTAARNGIAKLTKLVYSLAQRATVYIALISLTIGLGLVVFFAGNGQVYKFAIQDVWLMLGLSLPILYLSVADSFRQGMGQQHYNNYYAAIASALSIVGIFVLSQSAIDNHNRISIVILVMYGPILLVKLLNSFQVSQQLHSPAAIKNKQAHKNSKRLLLAVFGIGMANILIQLAVLLNKNIVSFYLIDESLLAMAKLEMAFRYFTIAGTFFATIQMPLWPLLAAAQKRKDYRWIAKCQQLLVMGFVLISLILLMIMSVYGSQILALWSGNALFVSGHEMSLVSYYFITIALNQAHIIVLMGQGKFGFIAKALLAESGLLLVLITSGLFEQHLAGILMSLIVARILTSAPMLVTKVWLAGNKETSNGG